MKFKWTMKTVTFLFVIILLAANTGFLFSYYNFYLSDKIVDNLAEAKDDNHKRLYEISNLINDKNLKDSVAVINNYAKDNEGYVTLRQVNGNIIYQNKSSSKMFSSTTIVRIDNINYELTYSSIAIAPGTKIIRNFIFYEVLLVSIIVIIMFFISSRRLIDPIETITKDINSYRIGKIPYKRKMPKNMQRIQNSFVDMVDSIESEKENQNRIIASISHDIKTPLTSVIGYTDLLKNNKLSKEKKDKYIEKIYNKSLMMKEILEEFDDYQSCNIKETLKKEKINIKNISASIKSDYEDELNNKKISLKINSNCNDKSIYADSVKIRRVFSNIISNSVKKMKEKKGVIIINIFCKDNMINFEIADNGGGISDIKNLKRIFEPLYTTDPSRKISGLGLSICNQIIGAHDGIIYAKNNEIGGLSIIFSLPKSI